MAEVTPARPGMRADARRNLEQIRRAAVMTFRDRGLDVPLEAIAKAAGVSKATIFNRFGGRVGLIEEVIEDVISAELDVIIGETRATDGAAEQLSFYLAAIRDLQYRIPAVNDLLLQQFPYSEQLLGICHRSTEIYGELVVAGHAAGTLRPDVTVDDVHALVVDNALALKHGQRPNRVDYDRRTSFVLAGIRVERRES
ncbi:TetR/AcrR family transcriptional regulator [Gordonia humi]|uniref:AcrR family transcriptional regulator n=1 Tax=Gordonia humi TaxID=686429 RepID=A0A840F6F4_9ACTN|nr:TetR/AcrR family transcriptional regulator [Gordonia humi]MBB4137988.1 AcrR family transcriptional regulator [Gordonia humi]